ncbi:DUF4190 domain-containing protein [Subtercola vilae]|uniref:DUF4190 domain-containing protein n=1 Tax=Subtercola vilae TaxID=2056433 RepID=A0A4T2BYF6_9MICO|nr:DUF4190 domain-containing protein [Subtercola vilae]TIH35641.1 DUF4190 domain-containing protein [Subtercola vilae]
MTDLPQLPPDDRPPLPTPRRNMPAATPAFGGSSSEIPLSKQAVASVAIACISLFVFGILGVLAVLLARRALRDVKQGTVRGRGIAIAGMIIGYIAAILYIINIVVHYLH